MGFVDGFGNPISIVGGLSINTDAYENNLRNVFSYDFKTANSNHALTDCQISDNGLVCTGFCKTTYSKAIPMDYSKAIMTFKYSGEAVLGLYLHMTLIHIDTAGKTITIKKSYDQTSAVPDGGTKTTISFDFVAGNEYAICLDKKSTLTVATIRDLTNGVETSVSVSSAMGHATSVGTNMGVVVFSGAATITRLTYYAPFYGQHLKCLILGDSITEGVGLESEPENRYSWKLLKDYFHFDGLICGVGGATGENGYNRALKLFSDMGYTFDNIIVYLGTNDNLPAEVLISNLQKNYQSYVDTLKERCNKIFWCTVAPNSDGRIWVNEAITGLSGLDGLIRFDLALGTDYNVHPNAEGHAKMYEYAKAELELIGV